MTENSAVAPRKRRSPPRRVVVEAIERVSPNVIRIGFGGEELAGFAQPRPGAHIKLFFPPAGANWPPSDASVDGPRPPSRTYTPRWFDAGQRRLEVEFVRHGAGLAATWAETARVGDAMTLAGPGGGYDVPPDLEHMVIVADDTAMPAAGMIVEALPPGCSATIFCEVANPAEELPLSRKISCAPVWLHRAPGKATPSTLLEQAVKSMSPQPPKTQWWVACEAGAMRRIKTFLLKERGIDPTRLHTRGYWRLGETNYPDHDYGVD